MYYRSSFSQLYLKITQPLKIPLKLSCNTIDYSIIIWIKKLGLIQFTVKISLPAGLVGFSICGKVHKVSGIVFSFYFQTENRSCFRLFFAINIKPLDSFGATACHTV